VIATRGPRGWSESALGLPRSGLELDGLAVEPDGGVAALIRARDGSWLALWDRGRLTTLRRDSLRALFGPAGLALDRASRPVVAYALWFPSRKTYLRLARVDGRGHLTVHRITRGGFPSTPVFAAATPVVLPSGAIHVVETYLPAAVEWLPARDWRWGQMLHSSALGVPVGAVAAGANGSAVFAAWTEAFPTLGPPTIVVAAHGRRAKSWVALEDAVLAGLAVTPRGPELAANRCVPAAAFGLEGNGVCGGLVVDAGVDGLVAGFAVGADGAHDLLLDTGTELDWYRAPGPLIHVSLQLASGRLTGRVDGASGGSVQVYRERPGQRALVATAALATDGSFTASDPTASLVVAAYRAVYLDAATGIPYAALAGPG